MARRATPQATQEKDHLILDAGAVIALSRRDSRARMFLERATRKGARVTVPSVVVAETTRGRGPRDASINQVLATIDDIAPATESTARTAGRLLGLAGSNTTIDALVVATAIERGAGRILTSDPGDLRGLTPRGSRVQIYAL